MRAGRKLSRGAGIENRHLEVLSEEVGGGVIGLEPTFLGEEAVDFVREDEFLEVDTLFSERFDERDCLVEGHVAIVIAVDEQDGRMPGTD